MLLVPLITPLDNGRVVRRDVAAMIRSLGAYADVLVPALSTGEGWALSEAQWRAMVATTVRHAGGRPVLAGALRPTTAEVLDRARQAARLGAAAIVATTPYGPVSQRAMLEHYAALAAGPLPVVVYHETSVSGNLLQPDTLLAVARLPGVLAVKDSAGATDPLRSAGITVWEGREEHAGGSSSGLLLAGALLAPELCARLAAAPTAADAAELIAICKHHDLFADDWYRSIKTELRARGVLTTAA